MGLTVHVIHPEDFVRLKSDGHLDLTASKRLLAQAGTSMRKNNIDRAVLDLRQTTTNELEILDLYELVAALADAGIQPSDHLAIIHKRGPGEGAKFFSLCASNRGWNVGAFATFEEAFEWLNRNAETVNQTQETQA